MQSFLQYRGFRAKIQAQLERDKEKYAALGSGGSTSQINGGVQSHADLEKGVNAADFGQHGSEPTHGGANRVEEEGQARYASTSEPLEEKEEGDAETSSSNDDDGEADDDDHELRAMSTMSRTSTRASANTKLGKALTGVDVRKRTTREGGEGNVFVVFYEGPDDPLDPHNWSKAKRLGCTFLVAGIGCVVGLASAIDSVVIPQAAKDFGVSEVVESLATGLFLIGFGVGALFAGPVSETVGRNPVYIGTLALFMIFIMASALAPNIGAQLAFRFIAGVFGSTPLTCAGGSLSDMWNPMERVWTFPIFANAAFSGPLFGPVIGGYIGQTDVLSWRWVEWVTLIVSGIILTLVILVQPETYPPTLLKWKAAHLRALTGDERYRAEIEIRQETFLHRLQRALWRPFLLTAREPIIMLVALYLTVVYIVLFTFLDGYTFIFEETYGISQGLTGICFLGIIVGLCCASCLVPLIYRWAKRDLKKIQEQGGERLPPEFRLWYSMLGGAIAIPISLFWMGWTARPDISIWSPLAASVLFGYGILCIFITCYQYIIDSYETYAASALASITLIRYIASGGMVVVGIPFYKNLGVPYTLTIMACLSALLVPVPYLFFYYGPWIRRKSKYAVTRDH